MPSQEAEGAEGFVAQADVLSQRDCIHTVLCEVFEIGPQIYQRPPHHYLINARYATEPNTTDSLTFDISRFIVLTLCAVLHKHASDASPPAAGPSVHVLKCSGPYKKKAALMIHV